MVKGEDKELIKDLMELDDKDIAVLFLNFYGQMKTIKNDMVQVLDLLDEFSENSDNYHIKKKIRKTVLDNFNEVPRCTKKMIEEYMKEE